MMSEITTGNNNTAEGQPVKKKRHILLKILFGLMMFVVIVLVGLLTYGFLATNTSFMAMRNDALHLVANVDKAYFRQHNASFFYDSQGEILSKARTDKAVLYVTGAQIPQSIKDIIVTVEDRRFEKHHGVDYLGLASIGVDFLTNGFKVTRGGSTITQQLARNMFLSHQVTLERKFKEMIIARELEKKFNKEEILEFYLNNIYFGNGAYGIESAAKTYFNKSCQDLSMNEQIFLLGIPSNPTLYDPFEHFDQAVYRKNLMVDILNKRAYIPAYTQAKLKAETITLNPQTAIAAQDYLQSYANHNAAETLMQLDGFVIRNRFETKSDETAYNASYDEAYTEANDKLKNGGYRIYTTLNAQSQPQLQQVLNDELAGYTEVDASGVYLLQGSACVIDNATGMVVNIIGGRDQPTYKMSLNRAYQSYRQPGSTIKPLVVYGPLMDDPQYGPRTMIGNLYKAGGPHNLDEQYSSAISMEQAVAYSKNVPAWNAMQVVGPSRAMSYLYKMDFRHIDRQDEYAQATALGGFTYGTNTLEMASAYSAFSREGKFIHPTCISMIESADGQVIYRNTKAETEVYSKRSGQLMTDMLQKVMRTGTGTRVRLKDRPSAGKTGTTDDLKDGWFVGYTPQYTMAVWVGYDVPRKVTGMQGGTYPGRIWQKSMNILHQGLPVQVFAEPDRTGLGGGASINVQYVPKAVEPETTLPTEPTESTGEKQPEENGTVPPTTNNPSKDETQSGTQPDDHPPANKQDNVTQPVVPDQPKRGDEGSDTD